MPEVEIPEVGTVVFPETMSMDAIRAASADLHSRRLAYGPAPVDFMGEAARAAAPVFEANRRQGMQADMRAARTAQERADLTASLLGGAGAVLQPFASTPENPLGGIGSAARPVGSLLNALGTEAERGAVDVARSYGVELGPVSRDVARAVPGIAAAMAGGPLMRAAGVPAELAPAAAFGAVPFAQTLDATGDTFAASKAGLTGAAIPGVAEAGRAAAAKTLGALVERGIIGTGASAAGNMGQKVVEALGAQGAIQVFMEGMNLPEYVAMTPEERQAALLRNLAVNSAFLMMDVPGVVSRSASQTRQGMKPVAKVGELMETLVNDPATVKALTAAADKFALEQLNVEQNPRIAQLDVPPTEFANVSTLPVAEAAGIFRGTELPGDPAPNKEVSDNGQRQEGQGRQTLLAEEQRPSRTIEETKAPATESPAVNVRKGTEMPAEAGATPAPEPVPQKPTKATKEGLRVQPPKTLQKYASAPTMEGIKKQIQSFYHGETKAVEPMEGRPGYYAVKSEMNGRVLSTVVVETKRGFYFGVDSTIPETAAKAKPVEPPAKAVEKVQEHVAEVAAGEKQATPEPALQHTTGPRAAKEIKSELVQRIEAELAKLPAMEGEVEHDKPRTRNGLREFASRIRINGEPIVAVRVEELPSGAFVIAENKAGPERKRFGYADNLAAAKRAAEAFLRDAQAGERPNDTIKIEIPGDGTFTVPRNRASLGELLTRAQRLETSAGAPKGYTESLPSREQGRLWMEEAKVPAPAESINTGALGEAGMGGAKPTEFTAGSGTPTSIKNATVDAERAKRGLPPAMEAGRRTWGEVWDRAMAVIDQDPEAQSTLIAQLKVKPRALTDLEDALLLHRQVDLQNQYGRLTRELAAAYDDAQAFPGRLEAVERLKVLVQETSNQLFELYEVGKAAGTETGRGLAARKMLADEHFELAQMEMDLRAAKEGTPLTDAERVKLTEAHDTIKRLQGELDAATARAEEARAERRAAEATEDLKQAAKADPEYNPVVIKLAERIVETLERRGKAAEARLKAKFARTSAGVDPTILSDVIEIGAGRIARKALPFAEWADGMLKEFGDAVKDYLEPAWAKIGERMDRLATDIAGRKKGEALRKMRVVDEGQRRQKLIDSLTEAAGEDRPLDEIGTYVRRLALQFVKDGINDRNKLVDAVHSVLVNHFDPEITRREAMDAISGYGDFKPLDPDPAKRTLRDLKGQLQSVAKLEDIEARRPLLKTGVERRAPSDEERRLIQQVNEAKRVHGVVTTDPARQLKSAQDGIVTRLKHQIADLNFQIEAGERTVKSAAKVASTPEIDGLRLERDALKRRLDEMLPRPGISEAQRLAMAERALEADLALYEAKIAARDTGPLRAKSAKLHSEKLEQLRARRDVLKAELNELRAAANPKLSPEERALRTLKRRLATQYAQTMDRIARQDFTPRRRVKEPFMDAEAAKLKGQLDQAKAEWRRALVAEKLKNRSGWEKAWDVAKEVTHAQRQFWTSMDFSAVLRQGGVLAFAHPGRALSSMPAMFRALSETQANAEWARIQGRQNWGRYQRAKLYLSDPHETTITKLEEQVRSRWLQNVPGIKQSNQTYTTFLNKLRADSFDAMVTALERKGTTLTDAELQGIANYINISTGRGDFGKLAGAADTLAMAFFSPRLLLSRFQYIVGQPLAKAGSLRVGRQIAAEYARTLTGFGVVLALGALAGAEIETDERSSDFLKLKIGNTRIDFGAGLLQPLVYLARTIHGETKTAGGEVKPIRGNVPFGSDDWADVTLNFGRSKFSPSMSTAWDLLTGKNVVGEKVDLGTAARDYALPLSFREVGEIMRQHGVPEGTTLMLLGMFGAGVSTRQNDERARAIVGELMKRIQGGTPEQREAIRERLLESLKR